MNTRYLSSTRGGKLSAHICRLSFCFQIFHQQRTLGLCLNSYCFISKRVGKLYLQILADMDIIKHIEQNLFQLKKKKQKPTAKRGQIGHTSLMLNSRLFSLAEYILLLYDQRRYIVNISYKYTEYKPLGAVFYSRKRIFFFPSYNFPFPCSCSTRVHLWYSTSRAEAMRRVFTKQSATEHNPCHTLCALFPCIDEDVLYLYWLQGLVIFL